MLLVIQKKWNVLLQFLAGPYRNYAIAGITVSTGLSLIGGWLIYTYIRPLASPYFFCATIATLALMFICIVVGAGVEPKQARWATFFGGIVDSLSELVFLYIAITIISLLGQLF